MSSDSNNSSSGPRLDRRGFLTGAAVTGVSATRRALPVRSGAIRVKVVVS